MIAANTGLFQRLGKRLQQLIALSLHSTSKGSLMWTGHHIWERTAEDDKA